MEYHYQDLCLPADHYSNEHYATDYSQSYMLQNLGDAEYEVRSSVLVDGGDRFGVSAVCFDKYEELVWMGNQGGHVTSYYGPSMQKYTSFQVHESEEVRYLTTVEAGIFALTKTTLRHQIRRGLPKFTYRSKNMKDMQCLYQVSPEKLIMGGHQNTLIDFDVTTNKECVISIQEDSCVVLSAGAGTGAHSVIACGSAGGWLTLRDPRSPGAAAAPRRAHSAALSDLDMQGNLLLTCGFADNSGVATPEPFVLVWDVRRLRSGAAAGGWAAPTPALPRLLHFLPAFSGRAAAVSAEGQVTLMQLNTPNNTENQSVFQVDTQNSACLVMDVASSNQGLVFGDQSGHLHLFSPRHNLEPVFNNFSRETEFADPPPTDLPSVSFRDDTFQYSTVPLPSLVTGEHWFNELPADFYKKVYRKLKPINPEVLKTMKMQGPIGYAPNPRTNRRNQVPYVPDNLEDVKAKQNEMKVVLEPVPRQYQKLDLRYNKHTSNEDIENCNKTGYPGLEATLPNAYCNSMLQVLYNTKPVKSILLAHSCAKEFCLSCELGFLFRMLDTSGSTPCQATNFLRAFRTVPEAAALGLILPDRGMIDPRLDFVALIQSWNRFILHQMHYEIVETRKKDKELSLIKSASSPTSVRTNSKPKSSTPTLNGTFDELNDYNLEFLGPTEFDSQDEKENEDWKSNGTPEGAVEPPENCNIELKKTDGTEDSDISDLFAIKRHQLNRCLKCNKEEERESVVLACALQYPPASKPGSSGAAAASARPSLAALVAGALCWRRGTPAWCDACRRYTPTAQQGRALRLPPILAINCGGVTAHEQAYWAKGVKDVAEIAKRGGSQRPCRYGLHCARPGCRFKHPERAGAGGAGGAGAGAGALPRRLRVSLRAAGDVVVNDKCETPTETNSKESPSKLNKRRYAQTEAEYTLSAAVVCVEDNPKNLVAYVRMEEDGKDEWHLFNDLCIVPVSEDEVLHFGSWWKTPCVLFYSSCDTKTQAQPPATTSS